jgi:CubicO group peptidase (beta-lactamase class C family)
MKSQYPELHKSLMNASSLIKAISLLIILIFVSCDQPNKNISDTIINGEVGTKLNDQLTPRIIEAMETHAIPGLSIGIVHNNDIIYAKGFGYENISTKSPVTTSSIFHMASISKTFVATAVMQLVESGKIGLDEKVIKYLPYFKMTGDDYKEITIRQMLGHISGMPNSNDYEWDKPQYDEGAIERFVRSLASEKMELRPGEKFRYSNIAFEVLGDVIAKVSGESFCDYQKNHILNPAGMDNSSFLKPRELPENWASPHEMSLKPFLINIYPYNRRHAPSSTLHSNALEMCNWALVNLNRGSFDKKKVLNNATYDELWNPWVKNEVGEIAKYGDIGLSWFVSEYKGEKTIGHGGSDEGFQTYFIMLPQKSIGVIVMANILPAPVEEITYMAIDIINGINITPIKPLASVPTWKILNENGIDEAVKFWNELKLNSSTDYDFNIQQFFNLYFSVTFNQEEDAIKIAEFCKKALSTDDILYLVELMEYALESNPEKQLTIKILDILKEK